MKSIKEKLKVIGIDKTSIELAMMSLKHHKTNTQIKEEISNGGEIIMNSNIKEKDNVELMVENVLSSISDDTINIALRSDTNRLLTAMKTLISFWKDSKIESVLKICTQPISVFGLSSIEPSTFYADLIRILIIFLNPKNAKVVLNKLDREKLETFLIDEWSCIKKPIEDVYKLNYDELISNNITMNNTSETELFKKVLNAFIVLYSLIDNNLEIYKTYIDKYSMNNENLKYLYNLIKGFSKLEISDLNIIEDNPTLVVDGDSSNREILKTPIKRNV